MNVVRLSKVNEVVHLWPFVSQGLLSVSKYLKYDLPLDAYRKTLFRLVKQPHAAWVGVAFDEDKCPVAFVAAHECTPFFSPTREFEISIFYHLPGYVHAITGLQTSLDSFCKTNSIKRYYVTTCRRSSSALVTFGEEWTGLKPAYRVFKKNLT